MAAGKWNIVVEQGAYWERTITVKDNGVARPLTGYLIRMHVRRVRSLPPTTEEPALSLTTENGRITITNAAGGEFVLQLDVATTKALDFGSTLDKVSDKPSYDIELVPPDGKVDRILEGTFQVSPEVTKQP